MSDGRQPLEGRRAGGPPIQAVPPLDELLNSLSTSHCPGAATPAEKRQGQETPGHSCPLLACLTVFVPCSPSRQARWPAPLIPRADGIESSSHTKSRPEPFLLTAPTAMCRVLRLSYRRGLRLYPWAVGLAHHPSPSGLPTAGAESEVRGLRRRRLPTRPLASLPNGQAVLSAHHTSYPSIGPPKFSWRSPDGTALTRPVWHRGSQRATPPIPPVRGCGIVNPSHAAARLCP